MRLYFCRGNLFSRSMPTEIWHEHFGGIITALCPATSSLLPFSFCLFSFLALVLSGLDTVKTELNNLSENTALCPDFLSVSFSLSRSWCWYIQVEECWVSVCFKRRSGGRRAGAMRGKIRGPQGLVWPCTLSIKCCLPMPRSALMRVC